LLFGKHRRVGSYFWQVARTLVNRGFGTSGAACRLTQTRSE